MVIERSKLERFEYISHEKGEMIHYVAKYFKPLFDIIPIGARNRVRCTKITRKGRRKW